MAIIKGPLRKSILGPMTLLCIRSKKEGPQQGTQARGDFEQPKGDMVVKHIQTYANKGRFIGRGGSLHLGGARYESMVPSAAGQNICLVGRGLPPDPEAHRSASASIMMLLTTPTLEKAHTARSGALRRTQKNGRAPPAPPSKTVTTDANHQPRENNPPKHASITNPGYKNQPSKKNP